MLFREKYRLGQAYIIVPVVDADGDEMFARLGLGGHRNQQIIVLVPELAPVPWIGKGGSGLRLLSPTLAA
jgi:hypothetical protein